jgi:hypothetical protein
MTLSQTSSRLSQNRPYQQKMLDHVSASSPKVAHTIPTVSVAVLPALKQNITNRSLFDSVTNLTMQLTTRMYLEPLCSR